MVNKDRHRNLVDEIVPSMFDGIVQDFGFRPETNLASFNRCDLVSRGLHDALANRGIDVRREFHMDREGFWHYFIAHTPKGAEPRENDTITDLNPWHFMQRNMPPDYTYFHGERGEVMDRLRDVGAPDYFVALRGLATVAKSHSLAHNDHKTAHIA